MIKREKESVILMGTLNKTDLVAEIATTKGISKVKAREELEHVTDTISDVLVAHKNIKLAGFGKFTVDLKPEEQRKIGFTGEIKTIPEHYAVKVALSKSLKDKIK